MVPQYYELFNPSDFVWKNEIAGSSDDLSWYDDTYGIDFNYGTSYSVFTSLGLNAFKPAQPIRTPTPSRSTTSRLVDWELEPSRWLYYISMSVLIPASIFLLIVLLLYPKTYRPERLFPWY